ncbi:ATP-binding protein [Candidatus Woesearchaeota archaeon]|nr:ATP-binding protein [Candidatus Woesearchaeota archaeon]
MVDVWFRKFGFSRNPFNIKPAAFSYELVGTRVDGVLSSIEEGKVLFVEAPLGYGKTTLLKSIIHRYGGNRKVIYAHSLNSEGIDVKGLLKRSSFASFITGSLPSGMILVVDESQNAHPDSLSEISEFYRSGNIRAVVFFGTKYRKDLFSSSLGQVMNGDVIRLSGPTPEQAISMIRSRIGNLPLLSNRDILSAYRKARGSPRRILQLCEDICRAGAERGILSSTVPAPGPVYQSQPLEYSEPEVSQPIGQASATESSVAVKPAVAVAHKKRKRVVTAKPVVAAKVVKLKPARPKPASMKAKSRQSSKKPASVKPSAKYSVTYKQPVKAEPEPIPEGSYWGEFMGMQK